ncbi:hypothetical protein DSC91_002004 [Paraburkholderia caffeinilytica]|uniref:Uncharacterized protein n=1 Tax=Paraburkholderia caffeinilytica TaxID=1761016 RepID=A0ABQ1MI02_9BURK|nr:hypothetical protein [Paraburkholderia caffeinilytica]AXL49991.1 hypothetical protein DSC91_002004 [Paraburkholderia caffeinilytica]GGC39473.1 hypothetical protein GCM10011400_27750 [Paraburkholderia caffeinilytica]CAB3786675.1 hypothetical protein LMG28690_02279 [Paraburkholderia caffeinilytica]
MISNHHDRPGRGLRPRAVCAIAIGAAAFYCATAAHAQQSSPALTCEVEVGRINQALQSAHQPALCERCGQRLAQTLDSLYRIGVLPTFYTSADSAGWDDPQRRPAMMSGHSLAGIPDGADLLADIDSGFGPRGIHRLRYTPSNQPVAITTADRSVSIPLAPCTPGGAP